MTGRREIYLADFNKTGIKISKVSNWRDKKK